MLENEYLELSNQLKEEFDKKDRQLIKLQEKHDEVLKCFLSVYGFIRVLDNCDEMDKDNYIETLRSYCSERFDEFFNID
jgi:hypothetical protein